MSTETRKLPSGLQIGIMLLLLAGGAPTLLVTYLLKVSWPWNLLVLIAYYVFALLVGFVVAVGQHVAAHLVRRAGDELIFWLESIFNRYQQQYTVYLGALCRKVDLRGLPVGSQRERGLRLEDVVIELTLDEERTAGRVSASAVVRPPATTRKSFPIWHYLRDRKRFQTMAVLAGPGMGKTTLLRHVALAMVDRKRDKQTRVQRLRPILIYLREHGRNIVTDPDGYDLIKAVQTSMEAYRQPSNAIPDARWFERKLNRGKCLVLIDGLDEVADREAVSAWVDQQIEKYRHNVFILTSRPKGYEERPPQRIMAVLRPRPLTPTQRNLLIRRWYLSAELAELSSSVSRREEEETKQRATYASEQLISRIRSSDTLAELATNPMLLTMITTLYRKSNVLPQRRVDLYQSICRLLLGERWESVRVERQVIAPEESQSVLQVLAYEMMIRRETRLHRTDIVEIIAAALTGIGWERNPDDFISYVQEASGMVVSPLQEDSGALLMAVEHQVFEFAHKTFQEFLAASHIAQTPKAEAVLIDALRKDPNREWWHETTRLYCAIADDATRVVRACLTQPLQPERVMLAVECAEEARYVDPRVREQMNSLLNMGAASPDPVLRRVVSLVLLRLHLKQMIGLGDQEGRWISKQPVNNAAYQVVVDTELKYGFARQPDHWGSATFPAGKALTPVCGLEPSDAEATCALLNQLESRGIWKYRLPQHGEWPLNNDESLFHWQQESVNYPPAGGGSPFFEAMEIGLDLFTLQNTAQHEQEQSVNDAPDGRTPTRQTGESATRSQNSPSFSASLISMLSPSLASTLASAKAVAVDNALANALTADSIFARVLAHDLDRNLALVDDHSELTARGRAQILDRALDYAHDYDWDPRLDLAHGHALDLARELDRARSLDRARYIDLALDSVRARGLAFNLLSDLDREAGFDPEGDLYLAADLLKTLAMEALAHRYAIKLLPQDPVLLATESALWKVLQGVRHGASVSRLDVLIRLHVYAASCWKGLNPIEAVCGMFALHLVVRRAHWIPQEWRDICRERASTLSEARLTELKTLPPSPSISVMKHREREQHICERVIRVIASLERRARGQEEPLEHLYIVKERIMEDEDSIRSVGRL